VEVFEPDFTRENKYKTDIGKERREAGSCNRHYIGGERETRKCTFDFEGS
jgi:hypothetical protein